MMPGAASAFPAAAARANRGSDMREAFAGRSTDWKEGINWAAVREWRLKRAHDAMQRHGLGAVLLMYGERMRYVSSSLTRRCDRRTPRLRYVGVTEGRDGCVTAHDCPWR